MADWGGGMSNFSLTRAMDGRIVRAIASTGPLRFFNDKHRLHGVGLLTY